MPALAAFASSKHGRPATTADVAVEELRAENGRLTEAVKELAVELSLVRGKVVMAAVVAATAAA